MSVTVCCQNCQVQFKTDEKHIGRRTKCPQCTHPLEITPIQNIETTQTNIPKSSETKIKQKTPQKEPTPNSPVPSKQQSSAKKDSRNQQSVREQLLNGFQGQLKRTRPTIAYRLGSLVVAVVMIILPIIYICTIALAAYGVYYHAVNHTGILETEVRGRGYIFIVLAYISPIVAGAILVLFMIKPLFFRQSNDQRTRSLRRESEPLLFEFVDKICAEVGAPKPKRIDLDCNVNASASFRRGWLSMFGSDLVLTIGLPLVAGLNTRQFAGVLAHEFGHFAQGAGMRLTYIIRSINFWFLRVVYQRDQADAWLDESAGAIDIRIGWMLYLAKLFVWITRGLLWTLMQFGNIVGCYLLRQMEYDADRYEARLAGSKTFEQTARQLQYLGIATQAAYSDLREFYRDGQLGDDLPRLIQHRSNKLPNEIKKQIDNSLVTQKTGWLDTHPSDHDRIVSAYKEDSDGIFQVELPSSVLFSNFEHQSKATTLEFYREQFGKQFDKNALRPVAEMFAKQEKDEASQAAMESYFQENLNLWLPLPIKSYLETEIPSPNAILKDLLEVRQQMQKEASKAAPWFESTQDSLQNLAKAYHLKYCLRANLKTNEPEIKKNPSGWVKKTIDQSERQLGKINREIEIFQKLAARRLSLSLQLLFVPQVAKRIPESANWQKNVKLQLECLQAISERMDYVFKISYLHSSLQTLVEQLQAGTQDEAVPMVIETLLKDIYIPLNESRNSWKRLAYPYKHKEKGKLLAGFLMPTAPIKDDLESIYFAGNEVTESTPQLYFRLLGDLVHIAETVESTLGLSQPKTITKAKAS